MKPIVWRRGAFTLIELLIVIAIIALLAAILFPVFAQARENSRRAACMSNLKQIGLGVHQYAQDYDERLPINGSLANVNNTDGPVDFMNPAKTGTGYGLPWTPNFFYGIYPYTKSTQIYVCPSAVKTTTAAYFPTALSASSYYGNGVVFRQAGLAMSAIGISANVVAMDESNEIASYSLARPVVDSAYNCSTEYAYWHYNTGTTEDTETYMNNHFNGSNFLYCDGHVRWKRVMAVTAADFGLGAGVVGVGTATPGKPTDNVNKVGHELLHGSHLLNLANQADHSIAPR